MALVSPSSCLCQPCERLVMEAAAYCPLTIAMTSLAVGVLKNSGSEKPRVAFRTKSAPLSAPLRDPLPYGVALLHCTNAAF
jgi:hypothetical protein